MSRSIIYCCPGAIGRGGIHNTSIGRGGIYNTSTSTSYLFRTHMLPTHTVCRQQ
jgi:hypothetical protein